MPIAADMFLCCISLLFLVIARLNKTRKKLNDVLYVCKTNDTSHTYANDVFRCITHTADTGILKAGAKLVGAEARSRSARAKQTN